MRVAQLIILDADVWRKLRRQTRGRIQDVDLAHQPGGSS